MPKLLLVEDDNNLREIYEARLQAEGYDIVAARDGEEALVVAKAEKPDLIVSDVMMPKISGFEMLDILRNTDELKHVKIIMLTALGQNDDQQRADKLGADRYLVKSQVTLEDIVKAAHELLDDQAATEAPAPSVEAAPAPAPVAAEPIAEPALAPVPEPAPAAEAPAPAVPTPDLAPEPAVVPEPVAAVPAVDDTATPPVADATDAPLPDTANLQAQTTAVEEAAVEAQIESFVAGATDDASTTDTSIPVTDPSTDQTTPSPVDPEVSAVDTAVVNEAVENLAAATPAPAPEPAPAAEAPAPAVPTPDLAPAPEPTPEAGVDTPVATTGEEATSGSAALTPSERAAATTAAEQAEGLNKPVGGVKVIPPLPPDDSKKDINELLALETAKEQAGTQPPAPEAVVATDEEGVQGASDTPPPPPAGANSVPPATPGTNIDPKSVAL